MSERIFPQPDVMSAQKHFSQIPSADIPRSRFDRSHGLKTTFDGGELIPIFCDEVLPGDTFHMDATAFARLATPLKPLMDNLYLDIHFFFVPNRLVWSNWEEFCGQRNSPGDDPTTLTIPVVPIPLATLNGNNIANYFGIPRVSTFVGDYTVNSLPFRAYCLIWNEWYRDQNLQNPVTVPTGNGPDSSSLATDFPFRRGKRHDYFTSCLPWPQKGNPVGIPLTGNAPVKGIGVQGATVASVPVYTQSDGTTIPSGTQGWLTSTASSTFTRNQAANPGRPDIYADLSQVTAVTINALRSAFQIQKLLERDARGGTRYIELILSHFGVRSDDARLQRPEYLGGGTTRININPVAATFTSAGNAPQANLSGVGTAVNRAGFTKSFTEHGHVIGLISARADLTYQQGAERMWARRTRYDFYWPAFAHLGEQAVRNDEIFIGDSVANLQTFGYQERYAEYRYKPSRITGQFNSNVATPLDVWHLSQKFASLPALNSSFILDMPPIDRVIAVPSEPHFLADVWFKFECQRPMPVYSVPGLVDHF